MKITSALSAGLLIVAAALIGALWASSSSAQATGSPQGRYQISAYGSATPGGVHHGCYIVDTQTGKVWHALSGGVPEKVADKLP
jgi:hypothetical protein